MTPAPRRDLPSSSSAASTGNGATSTQRLVTAAVVGVVAGVAIGIPAKWEIGVLSGWIAGSGTYEAWLWLSIRRLNAERTAAHAVRDDPGRGATDLVVLVAAVLSLVGVGIVIAGGSSEHGLTKAIYVAVSVLSVVAGWLLVHLSYTTRYARLYYTGGDGGVDFNEDAPPCYADFAYLAFTIGMTFQVSDNEITNKEIRGTALRHALLAYLFGAVIIGTMINLLAGLSK